MSTICKLCLKASESDAVSAISTFLDASDRPHRVETSEWPLADEHRRFDAGDGFPSVLSVKAVGQGFVEIHYNSFSTMAQLGSELSSNLDTPVVVNLFQSTATASYWGYHRDGQLLREIDAGDGQVFDQKGVPLDFENEPPGHDISDQDSEPCMIFDDDDLNEYNAAVGISLEVYQEYDEGWINLIQGRVALDQTGDERRPWWKFW